MTPPPAHRPAFRPADRPRHGGFTLFEMLVTIGIITILAGIALPALMSVRRSAKRTAITNQLQMIYTGLEAFKHENNDRYPQIDLTSSPASALPWTIGDNGAFALCRALFSPAPAGPDPTKGVPGPDELVDFKDGPGFRTAFGSGKVFGPYINPDGFRFGYAVSDGAGGFRLSDAGVPLLAADYARLVVADGSGKPILYCPPINARPRFTGPTSTNIFFADSKYAHTDPKHLIYFDLDQLTGHPLVITGAMEDFRGLLRHQGDADESAFITRAQTLLGVRTDPGNVGKLIGTQPTFTFSVLLWSAGVDGEFGAAGGKNLDDVVLGEQVQ